MVADIPYIYICIFYFCREISQDLETIVKKSEAITADLRIFGDLDSLQYSAEKTRVHLEVHITHVCSILIPLL